MSSIMVSNSFQKESYRFVLDNFTFPITQDGYGIFLAGYILYPSFLDDKKIKNIGKIFQDF